jgi:predicted TIM-barrel fold metal-dependent hydrolase
VSTPPERICDAHHHLWSRTASHYVVDDLLADLATVPQVGRTVFVECGAWYRNDGPDHLRSVGETAWVASNGTTVTQAIVGSTDLRLGSHAEEALDAHLVAGQGRFRGIRQMATWDASPLIRPTDPDPGPSLLLDPDFRRGFAALARRGLSFDAWVYFPQLPEVVDLARAFPDATIVLDHFGGPIGLGPYTDRAAVLALWRELMVDVAACPNVVVKLGGIGMPIYGLGWHKQPTPPTVDEVADLWRGPIRWCLEHLGVDRCMFESNFPVDRFSIDYATVWATFDAVTQDLSPVDRAALFHDTACAVYRLPHEGPAR